MRRFSILIFLMIIVLFPKVSSAEKTGGEHARIWRNAGVTAAGVGNLVKIGGALVRIFKPNTVEELAKVTEKVWGLPDTYDKVKDPTGAGWLLWSATTAAEVGSTILETAVPAVRIGNAALDVGYAYYRNWQDEWMEELEEEEKEPYTEKELPPELPKEPTDPGKDHPDDYMGVLENPTIATPVDDLQRLLQKYDDLSLNYLAFEVGMSIDDPVCDAQMAKFVQKLKTTNPNYEKHLEEVKQKSEETYQLAYEVQKKICLLYYGTITETTEFPHFKTQKEITNFLNSLTPQQKQEILDLQKIFFDKMNLHSTAKFVTY